MRIFTKAEIDPRKLTHPWFLIGRQHPGRREAIYGRLHPMFCGCRVCAPIEKGRAA